jgi:hypothetical protein
MGSVYTARHMPDTRIIIGLRAQREWRNIAVPSVPQAAGHSTPCFSSPTGALHPGCHQDRTLCSGSPQVPADANQHDSMQPPSIEQVDCSRIQHEGVPQMPYETGLQGSGSAWLSTDGSFYPSSEFQAVYGGFNGSFYGCANDAPGVSGQTGSGRSGREAGLPGVYSGPPGVGAAGLVDGGDPEEQVLILQEVTEEEVGPPCSCPIFCKAFGVLPCVCEHCAAATKPQAPDVCRKAAPSRPERSGALGSCFVHDAWSDGGCATEAEPQQYEVQTFLGTS